MKILTKSLLLSTLLSAMAAPAQAEKTWYRGVVDRVLLYGSDGEFVVTLNNDSLKNCLHQYAYFDQQAMSAEKLRSAYAMALTSLTASQPFGVVIDPAENGENGKCLVRDGVELKIEQ